MSLFNVFQISGSGMSSQAVRLNTTASNIANAESVSSSTGETYRSRQVVFSEVQKSVDSQFLESSWTDTAVGSGVGVMGIVESDAPLRMSYEPDHPYANEEGYVAYPNVNIMEETANMISASRNFQNNVEILNTAKQMMQRVLTLGQ